MPVMTKKQIDQILKKPGTQVLVRCEVCEGTWYSLAITKQTLELAFMFADEDAPFEATMDGNCLIIGCRHD